MQDELLRSAIYARMPRENWRNPLPLFMSSHDPTIITFRMKWWSSMAGSGASCRNYCAISSSKRLRQAKRLWKPISIWPVHWNRKQLLEDALLDIVSNPWKRLVYDKEGRVTKRGYIANAISTSCKTACGVVMYTLRTVIAGEIHGPSYYKTRNGKANRIQVCRSLVIPESQRSHRWPGAPTGYHLQTSG